MASTWDLGGKRAGWKRHEYKHISSLSISIRFDYDNLEDSSVRTSHVDDGYESFKVDYAEMQWIEKQIDAALEMKARTIRLTITVNDGRVEKRCNIRT